METRGLPTDERPKGRPAIARRSCDQCRSRKIGCDRGSPCSNCRSARVECTFSAVAPQSAPPRQRLLISAQYERKIDDIARDIDGIKHALRDLNLPGEIAVQNGSTKPLPGYHIPSEAIHIPLWDHSVHVMDFVRVVVEHSESSQAGDESASAISSLKSLLHIMGTPGAGQDVSVTEVDLVNLQTTPRMPPLDAVVAVLRWAKSHQDDYRIRWICEVLPLQKFEDVCRKVYFAVEDYTEVDVVIASGFLSYVFAEHAVSAGDASSRNYCEICQISLLGALFRLPFILPASMEAVAALTLGAVNSIENSKAARAWIFISGAMNLCQTLGYHRLNSRKDGEDELQGARERLFWTVYRLEKSLSLRLGRPSGIRDTEITLPLQLDEPRSTKIARIQGQIYDHLYSPAASYAPEERGLMARKLEGEVRELLSQIQMEISDAAKQPNDHEYPMRLLYLYCDLVCQSSVLVLILRAIPTGVGSEVPEDCAVAARDALDVHHQCIMRVQAHNDSFPVSGYLNWAILHVPFVPFSVIFTRAVQETDIDDLARLERFTASLKPPPDEDTKDDSRVSENIEAAELMIGAIGDENFESLDLSMTDLSEWYFANQQLMGLLDEQIEF